MRLNDSEVSFVKSGQQTDVEEFGVADLHLLIGISRDQIYRDKIRVITQEYMCNALDAHIEMGITDKPIEVTVPTTLSPILKIKDYGVGIGDERLSIFTKYGDSTKRGDDDNIGGFGLGCKCAWSYTESFTVDTVFEQDGKKYRRVYSAYITHQRDPGNIRPIKEQEVDFDTPTGTTISIPVMDNDAFLFRNLALFAALFWKTKPIFYKDDNEIEADDVNVVEDNGSWLVHKSNLHRIDDASVIVGGVCYPIDFEILTDGKSDYEYTDDEVNEVEYKLSSEVHDFIDRNSKVSLIAGVGEVDVKPSREELDYTIKTMKFLIDGLKTVYEEGVRRANEYLKQENCIDVVKSFDGDSLKLRSLGVKWNDIVVSVLMSAIYSDCWLVDKDSSHRMGKIPVSDITDRTIVVCYATEHGAKNGVDRMKNFINHNQDYDNGIIFYSGRYDDEDERKALNKLFVTHDRIPAVRVKGASRKINGLYQQYSKDNGYAVENINDIDFDKAVFFMRKYQKLNCALIDWQKGRKYRISYKNVFNLLEERGYKVYSVTEVACRRLVKSGHDLVFVEDILEEEVAKELEKTDMRYEPGFSVSYDISNAMGYLDELMEYADRNDKIRLKIALKAIKEYRENCCNDYDYLINLARFFEMELNLIPVKYYGIADKIISKCVPFLKNLSRSRNQVSVNIIRSYEEFDDES
jgi:hypothetical protein